MPGGDTSFVILNSGNGRQDKKAFFELTEVSVKKLKILCIMIIVTKLETFQINQTVLCFSAFI